MKNPFQKFIDRYNEREAAEEEEQRQRKIRLQQLEEKKASEGFGLRHLGKSMETRKEIKRLQKEIKEYEKRKEQRKSSWFAFAGLAAVMCLSFIMIAVGSSGSSSDDGEREVASAATAVTTESESETETTETTEETSEQVTERTTEQTTEQATEQTTVDTETTLEENQADTQATQQETTLETTEEEEIAAEETTQTETAETVTVDATEITEGLTAEDLSIYIATDYSHIDSDIVILGNNEGATITVTADQEGVTGDDIVIAYDDSLLSVQFNGAKVADGKTTLTYYVTGNQACDTELDILTADEYNNSSDGYANMYPLEIQKLDSSKGQICYVTPTGTKYHFSQSCAGENASATTYYDATAAGYEPCGTCAQ